MPAAHRASLLTGTVAVWAGGHDRVYPPEHSDLLEEMLADGAAISEMPLGWEPRARDFPRRNRLISGLSLGVVIVEAPAPSEAEPAADERARIVALLGPAPVSIDDLIRLSQTSPAIVRMVLLEREIAGRLERHGGALVSLL